MAVTPEHVNRAAEIVHCQYAAKVAYERGRPGTAWLLRRLVAHLRKLPLDQ